MSEFNECNYDDESDFDDEDFVYEDEFFDCNSTFVWDCPPNETSYDKEAYAKWTMFEPSKITVWEVLNMILALTIRFNLSYEAQQAILELIKILAGPSFTNLDVSKYLNRKLLNPAEDLIKYVFYCTLCNKPLADPVSKYKLKNKDVACLNCKKEYKLTTKTDNFFMILNLEHQLRQILNDPEVRDSINNNILNQKNNRGITDVCDGYRYKEDNFIKSKQNKNEFVLTLNVNIDGTSKFNSSKHSIWPIQCIVNEIPKLQRNKFVLLAALWCTISEPKPQFMNLYLKYFLDQVSKLTNTGIKVTTGKGTVITYFCKIFSFPLDSVARPILQNRLDFNGYFGCSWCYHRGVYVANSIRYPLLPNNPEERNHEKYLQDVLRVKESSNENPSSNKRPKLRSDKGIKGSSILSQINDFDCVWGFSQDYVHAVLLGVTRQLWEQWSKTLLTVADKKLIDERLISIKPPNEIHRVPRIMENRKNWKATEWRSWLLYYSVPVLTGILEQRFLDSYKLFVRSIFVLLKTNISAKDLLQSKLDLFRFVYDCQIFYKEPFMTFNVHSLLHTVDSVKKNGPLSVTSTYPFEGNMLPLKETVTSPKGVLCQMADRTLRNANFQNQMCLASTDNESWSFCRTLLNKRKYVTKNYKKTQDGAFLIKDKDDNSQEFNRCIFKGTMYHSELYTRTNETDNSVVFLNDMRYAKIESFLPRNNITLVKIKFLQVSTCDNLTHLSKVVSYDNQSLFIKITDIAGKLVSMCIPTTTDKLEYNTYVSQQPNNFEIQ